MSGIRRTACIENIISFIFRKIVVLTAAIGKVDCTIRTYHVLTNLNETCSKEQAKKNNNTYARRALVFEYSEVGGDAPSRFSRDLLCLYFPKGGNQEQLAERET